MLTFLNNFFNSCFIMLRSLIFGMVIVLVMEVEVDVEEGKSLDFDGDFVDERTFDMFCFIF